MGVLELDVRGPGVALAFLLVLGPADHLLVLPVYALRSGVGDPVRVQPGAGDLLAGLDVNRHFLHAGRPQGNQLVADNGFAALADAYAQETIDALAGAIYKIAVGVLLEITHPGQIQTLKAVRIGGVDDVRHILVAHQEESVAHDGAVRGVAGVVGGGGKGSPRCYGNGAPMGPLEQSPALQNPEVAPGAVGGDLVELPDFRYQDPARFIYSSDDIFLAFFHEHF